MNILVLGSGAREHAFAWKLKQSPLCEQLYVAPGNAGTQNIAHNVAIQPTNFEAIAQFCLEKNIHLLLVGSEEPLVLGITDFFESRPELQAILLVAPNKKAAQMEGSKDFSKQFMVRYGIPTAKAQTFQKATYEAGLEYLAKQKMPIVLKADGLAAGKGVLIAQSPLQARKFLADMLLNEKFGKASAQVLIEEYLEGIELSVFVLIDGKNYLILPEAKDYKRALENDEGLNTGGMGAVSPVPFADADFMRKVEERIIIPTLKGFAIEDIHYVGFLFIGLMNVQGNPYVIEYNARMGDPETEVVLPRIKNDWAALMKATAEQKLHTITLSTDPQHATTVVLVSGGYPEKYEKGKTITHLETIEEEVIVLHAGTRYDEKQNLLTDGGRVLALTALAPTLDEALQKSLQAAEKIQFEGKHYRKDIGKDVLKN